ncbi:polysaccharide biosynthesis tyrosine autokinase [Aquimarina sp. ERC-38]|uniref:GumC family protein n=1 Tax=Aquimarina sp. ERC-38 TaxID=2949996 RepID=UPI0022486AAE|nr:polysaccharide biosynthesis tyrosine autokinase [Aquimarina sp. ERC-38]UZO80228.1 polysaccharide biosynthesis tyrosine autokinase [Aquimarina sp. ERC-38]
MQGLNDNSTLKKTLEIYLKKWYWYLICILLTITAAYFYIRYTAPEYQISATLLITDEEKTGSGPDLSSFQDFISFGKSKSTLENEMAILTSRTLMHKVVKDLNLNVQYFKKGRVIEVEDYPESIIKLNLVSADSIINKNTVSIPIRIESAESYTVLDKEGNELSSNTFGKVLTTKAGKVIITPNTDLSGRVGTIINAKVIPPINLAMKYSSRLKVSPVGETSTTLQISFKDKVKLRAQHIINSLLNQYIQDNLERKRNVSQKTSDFIDNRLSIISGDLEEVDEQSAGYKSKNLLTTDIAAETQRIADSDSRNQEELNRVGTQLNLIEEMRNYISNQKDSFNMIPSNLGFSDSGILEIVNRYNSLITRRNSLLRSSSIQNPIVVNLDQQIVALKQVLASNLDNFKRSITLTYNNLKEQNKYFTSKIYRAPKQQKDLIDIQRKITIKEQLYLYLLQKREEAEITSKVTEANSMIIDDAIITSAMLPVSPKKKIIYIAAFLFGLIIPTSFIYLAGLLNVKVESKDDMKHLNEIPFIGSIPKEKKAKNLLISRMDRSGIAEAFRILRTNLEFLLASTDTKGKGKVVFVTSTISGEGKTLISSNLSKVLSLSEKKVVLVGTDFRDPKMHKFFDLPQKMNTTGFSNFITDHNLKPENVLYKEKSNDSPLTLLPPGVIPPNPSELLMNIRVQEMMNYLKDNFDYIIVDTAPVSLVTDTLLIAESANLTIYLVRENFTEKNALNTPYDLYTSNRLENMAILLNGARSRAGYGYGYGYGSKS